MRRLARLIAPSFPLIWTLLALLPAVATAVPNTLNMQGFLRSAAGGPVPDGDYGITVRFYEQAEGGPELYSDLSAGVKVQGGVFDMVVGVVKPLDGAVFTSGKAAWVGVAIGSEPELPRVALRPVPYALRAEYAANLDPTVLSGLAKQADLAKVALSGKFSDLIGGPDLSGYVQAAALAKVAASGKYSDLVGLPDLGGYVQAVALAKVATTGAWDDLIGAPDLKVFAKKAELSAVATSGNYADLNGIPTFAKLGTGCGSGLFVRGLLADGGLDCAAPSVTVNLPADGLAAVSNGAMTNVFVVKSTSAAAVPIPDNSPIGASSEIVVPDVGNVQALTVAVDIANSDIATLTVKLYDPNLTTYVLHDKSGAGGKLEATYPKPTAPASGELGAWLGKNPKGKWRLEVIDGKFLNNKTDGELISWSVTTQAVSAKNVEIKGDVTIGGALQPGQFRFPVSAAPPFPCSADLLGYAYVDAASNDLRVCRNGKWLSAVFRECGNGVVEAPEACDDGVNNGDAPNKCRTSCVKPSCGDKIVDTSFGEACDDGNNVPDDGCDKCQLPCVGANAWLYKGVCLKAVVQSQNVSQVPAGCNVYQPAVSWGQAEFVDICNYFAKAMNKSVACGGIDADADGGLCSNFPALLSYENNGAPDVWVHATSFKWNPSAQPNTCNMVNAGDDTVVYACK